MIAALLTTIAADIRVSVAPRPAFWSPSSRLCTPRARRCPAALFGRVDRRQLLLGSMSLFAVFNMARGAGAQFLGLRDSPRTPRVRSWPLHAERQRTRGRAGACRAARLSDCHRQRGELDGCDRPGCAARRAGGRAPWMAHDVRREWEVPFLPSRPPGSLEGCSAASAPRWSRHRSMIVCGPYATRASRGRSP